MRHLRILAAALVVFAALAVWRLTYGSQCASGVIPLLAIALIGFQTAEYAVFRRRCFADCAFSDGSFLHRFYSRTVLATALAIFVSAVAGLSLFLNLLTWTEPVLALLAADGLLLALVAPPLIRISSGHLRPGIARIAAKNIIAAVNAALLLGPLLAIQYYSPFPPFVDTASLPNTITQALQAFSSQCLATDFLAKLQAAKEGFSWWLMLKANVQLSDPTFRAAAWIIFLVSGSLSVWAYSKLIVQAADLASGSGERND
jgi:hypothetical protein